MELGPSSAVARETQRPSCTDGKTELPRGTYLRSRKPIHPRWAWGMWDVHTLQIWGDSGAGMGHPRRTYTEFPDSISALCFL